MLNWPILTNAIYMGIWKFGLCPIAFWPNYHLSASCEGFMFLIYFFHDFYCVIITLIMTKVSWLCCVFIMWELCSGNFSYPWKYLLHFFNFLIFLYSYILRWNSVLFNCWFDIFIYSWQSTFLIFFFFAKLQSYK